MGGKVWQYKVAIADILKTGWDKIKLSSEDNKEIENTKIISFELQDGQEYFIELTKKSIPLADRINILRKNHTTGRC